MFWKEHILQRMRQRNINVNTVLDVLKEFEIIEEYKDDRPFPSYLLIGYKDTCPLHVVAAVNCEDMEIHLILYIFQIVQYGKMITAGGKNEKMFCMRP